MVMSNGIEGLVAEAGRAPDLDLDGLYRRHGEKVSRWVKRLWGRQDAEDVLHEVFMVVQRRLPEFRGDSALTTWLYAITVRATAQGATATSALPPRSPRDPGGSRRDRDSPLQRAA
jgi:hypothetical protein